MAREAAQPAAAAGAIDAGDWEELAEELGDLLFQAVRRR